MSKRFAGVMPVMCGQSSGLSILSKTVGCPGQRTRVEILPERGKWLCFKWMHLMETVLPISRGLVFAGSSDPVVLERRGQPLHSFGA